MIYYLATVTYKRSYNDLNCTTIELVLASNRECAREAVYKKYEHEYPCDEFNGSRDIYSLYVEVNETIIGE